MNPLDISTPLDCILPTFTLCFHELSYVGLSFLVQMCFTWQFFPSLGTLEESVLEDHFHLLHTLLAYPSYPLACCSIMSSTLLDIGLNDVILLEKLMPILSGGILCTYLLVLKKYKKMIYLKNPKKNDIFQKSKKMIYSKKSIKKMIYCENSKNWKMS